MWGECGVSHIIGLILGHLKVTISLIFESLGFKVVLHELQVDRVIEKCGKLKIEARPVLGCKQTRSNKET